MGARLTGDVCRGAYACRQAVQIDTARAMRRPDELAALVLAVVQAHPADELDWIEWKSGLDLSAKLVQGSMVITPPCQAGALSAGRAVALAMGGWPWAAGQARRSRSWRWRVRK